MAGLHKVEPSSWIQVWSHRLWIYNFGLFVALVTVFIFLFTFWLPMLHFHSFFNLISYYCTKLFSFQLSHGQSVISNIRKERARKTRLVIWMVSSWNLMREHERLNIFGSHSLQAAAHNFCFIHEDTISSCF